jgi:ribosomal protein S4
LIINQRQTILQARQLVNHRHILVNSVIVDISSYRCKPQDIITARDEQKSRTLIWAQNCASNLAKKYKKTKGKRRNKK